MKNPRLFAQGRKQICPILSANLMPLQFVLTGFTLLAKEYNQFGRINIKHRKQLSKNIELILCIRPSPDKNIVINGAAGTEYILSCCKVTGQFHIGVIADSKFGQYRLILCVQHHQHLLIHINPTVHWVFCTTERKLGN